MPSRLFASLVSPAVIYSPVIFCLLFIVSSGLIRRSPFRPILRQKGDKLLSSLFLRVKAILIHTSLFSPRFPNIFEANPRRTQRETWACRSRSPGGARKGDYCGWHHKEKRSPSLSSKNLLGREK